jgi:hypothetical protein
MKKLFIAITLIAFSGIAIANTESVKRVVINSSKTEIVSNETNVETNLDDYWFCYTFKRQRVVDASGVVTIIEYQHCTWYEI